MRYASVSGNTLGSHGSAPTPSSHTHDGLHTSGVKRATTAPVAAHDQHPRRQRTALKLHRISSSASPITAGPSVRNSLMTSDTGIGSSVAIVVPALDGGGAERVAATLAREFARVASVTVVTFEPRLSRRSIRHRP